MNGAGPSLEARDTETIPSLPPSAPSRLAAALSLLTIGLCCVALLPLDLPVLRFLRSVDLSAVEWLGNVGERIGNGGSLVAVSLALVAIGWWVQRTDWRQAGIDSLFAHGCVGLLVNGLKHLIGRPRPRLTHSGDWHWWPSWESGLDSFPSGHSSATFAVVTVLVKYWPRAAWIGYALATWVAMSRVWRGSHFVTDVVAGMVVGVVIGSIFAGPIREWRETLLYATSRVAPIVVAITSFLWLMLRRVDNPWLDRLLLATGVGLIAVAFLVHWRQVRDRTCIGEGVSDRLSRVLIGVGLALTTGSLILVGLAMLAAAAWWVHESAVHAASISPGSHPSPCTVLPLTAFHAFGTAGAVLLIQHLKGIIPLH